MSDKLYFNGDIITMENELYCEAVLVRNNLIYKVGSKKNLEKIADPNLKLINLHGKTMIPSFIDCHSHFIGFANTYLQVSLKNARNSHDVINIIRKYRIENNIPKGKWIIANNYDDNKLEEKCHINKKILDKASPLNPVVVQHQSGHSGVFNSLGLKELNINNNTKDPEGGKIYKENKVLTGVLEENAFINNVQKIPMPSLEDLIKAILKAQNKYASFGITTMQEGMIVSSMTDLIYCLMKSKLLKLDYIGYIDMKDSKNLVEKFKEYDCIRKYNNHFKIGGYKIFLDGSPQNKTAFMLEPYKNCDAHYRGYKLYNDDELRNKIETAITENMQLLAHCNGDAACRQYINMYREAKEHVLSKNNIRPVIIHAQLLQKEQLNEVKELNMIPSFFIAHVYYFGDTHIKNFGFERASQISPANSALKEGVLFTFHQDSPVIQPNMLETINIAVNRMTKKGVLLGEDERICVLDALKAVTINGAYEYFEEDIKGSIKENKYADFVILDKNPLKVDCRKIKNIKVLETIKSGETIFKLK